MKKHSKKSVSYLSLFFLFSSFIFSCMKSVEPVVFYATGKFSVSENSFYTDGVMIISFPSEKPGSLCLVKIFPHSSVKVIKTDVDITSTNHIYIDVVGLVEVRAKNCVFRFEKVFVSDAILRVSRYSFWRFEVLDGEIKVGKKLRIVRGQGYIPQKNEIYAVKDKPEIIFPRNNQKFYVPFFLWSRVRKVRNYYLEIALDKDFLFPIFIIRLKQNRFFPPELSIPKKSDYFFWRVWYELENGAGSFYSEARKFFVPGQN